MANFKIENKKILSASVKNININRDRVTPVRPEYLNCDIFQFKVKGIIHTVLVGLLDEVPYELFVTFGENVDIEKYKQGYIRKLAKGRYDLIIKNNEEEKTLIKNISAYFDSEYGTLSRFISMGLRHGVPIAFIIDQLSKDKNFIGFERSVSRVLKKYLKDGERVQTSEVCPVCGESNLIFSEGCKTCASCGWSKCG